MTPVAAPGALSQARPDGGRSAAVIEVRQLTKRFGAVTAVDRLSFQVGTGTVTGFLGPNGAGKTTTLRMLLGLVRPDSGQASIWGKRYADLGERRRMVGVVLEASRFHPGRTVRDHLRVRSAAVQPGPGRRARGGHGHHRAPPVLPAGARRARRRRASENTPSPPEASTASTTHITVMAAWPPLPLPIGSSHR